MELRFLTTQPTREDAYKSFVKGEVFRSYDVKYIAVETITLRSYVVQMKE